MKEFTTSELAFLRLLSHGLDVDEATRHVGLRADAGAQRLARLKRALSATTTAHLVATALRRGLIQ